MQLDGQYANERFTQEWTDDELDTLFVGVLAAEEREEDGESYDRFYPVGY